MVFYVAAHRSIKPTSSFSQINVPPPVKMCSCNFILDDPFGDQDLIAAFLVGGGGEKAPIIYTGANGMLAIAVDFDVNADFAEMLEI